MATEVRLFRHQCPYPVHPGESNARKSKREIDHCDIAVGIRVGVGGIHIEEKFWHRYAPQRAVAGCSRAGDRLRHPGCAGGRSWVRFIL